MAYLPYRMYGNGNFHLPIIDIVQTINSNSHVCRKSKLSKPIITCSSKGLFGLKGELDSGRRTGKQLRNFSERKTVSYNYLPKRVVFRDEEKQSNEKWSSQSNAKILKIRKNAPQCGNKMVNCNRDSECLGEKKSLKVLFRAGKSSGVFDNEGLDEEEFDFSFLRGSAVSSADLKRKGSFVDYIRMKRRKGNESTQAFHFADGEISGVLEPSGIQFFGSMKKLKNLSDGTSENLNDTACEACGSVNGFITNDYQNKISFLSTRLPVDSNVSSLLKQAAIRSLSCEVVPGREGQIYFGDSVCGHVLSNTFFLKDAQARGFHRWYSILVFMKDKHFLLNSWNFFQLCINQIVSTLKRQTVQVYSNEQNARSQRAFRLSGFDQKHSTARSLLKLTASTKVFSQLHVWFTWLLSTAVKRVVEFMPAQLQDINTTEAGSFCPEINNQVESREGCIYHLRQLRRIFGIHDFQRLLYSTLIGQQVVVRGPKSIVENIIKLLQLFLPARKIRCQEFDHTYRTPDVYNLVGLDLWAAVPMSTDTIMRLDIIPFQETGSTTNTDVVYSLYKFIVRSEQKLPDKLPSLLIKIDKALADDSLTNGIVWLRVKCLIEQWLHMAEVIKEVKKRHGGLHAFTSLTQSLGIQEQDHGVIEFWTS